MSPTCNIHAPDDVTENLPVPAPLGLSKRQAILVAVLAILAMISLFANLGAMPLRMAEGRWAMIARHMHRTGELLNPLVGPEAYWDKPLLSYWQILPFAGIAGEVTECTARLPSALWAMALLILTFDIARRWFDPGVALASAGVLATSWGFVEWGRSALVEMSNAGVILLALWCFLTRSSNTSPAWVYQLAAITGLGANLKGLPAYAVPGSAILALSLARSDWKWLQPWKSLLLAACLSLAVYLAIPVAGCVWSSSAEPLRLVWKENVVRFFAPFDHKQPFYTYAWRIFDLGAPWALFLPVSLIYYLGKNRPRDSRMRDVLVLAGAIVLFFTLSGSRRRYYILPVLPFLAIVTGDLLTRFARGQLPRWTARTVTAIVLFLGTVAVFIAPAYCLVPAFLPDMPLEYGSLAPAAVLLATAGGLIVASALRKSASGIVLSAVGATCVCSMIVVPWVAGQPAVRFMSEGAHELRAMDRPVAFLYSDDSSTAFYLDREYAVLLSEQAAEEWAARTHGVVVVERGEIPKPWQLVVDGHKWKAYRLPMSQSAEETHLTGRGWGARKE